MKIRFLLALLGLAISFAVPTIAQQKDTAGPRIVQQRDLLGIIKTLGEFGELDLKLDEAYKNELPLVFEDGRQKDGVRTRSWECFHS